MNMIAPPPLSTGDQVAIVAPAGYLNDKTILQKGLDILEHLGFSPRYEESASQSHDYLSNPDGHRSRELETCFCDPDIKAIIALRGGYGCLRIISDLSWEKMKENPKFFIGFSDISILANQITEKSGLITFHGPTLSTLPLIDRTSIERLNYCLRGSWQNPLKEDIEIVKKHEPTRGKLSCWNLASLVSLLGTPFSPDLKNKIVLLEDINEPPYRLDKLFTQLYHAGKLHDLSGLILGSFSADANSDKLDNMRLEEFVWNRVLELTQKESYPIWGKFPIGHLETNIAMPIGAYFQMSCERGVLSFAE